MARAAPGLMNGTALTPPGKSIAPPAAPEPDADDHGGAADGDSDDSMSPQATPKQQAQLNQFIAQCQMLIYNRKTPQNTIGVIKMLKSGNPVEALAHVAMMIAMRVEHAAQQASDPLDPAVMLQGGKMLIDDIAQFSVQIAKAQGTPVFTDTQKQQAFLLAVDMYRRAQQAQGQPVGGLTQPAAQQLFGQYKQASQAGDLDSVLPGASEAAQVAPALAKQPAPPSAPPKGTPAPGLVSKQPPKKKRRRR